MSPTDRLSASRPVVAAVVAIAATYVYFLLYAEFALLRLAEPHATAGWPLRTLMAILAGAGICGGVLAAASFRRSRAHWALAAGFSGCALSAFLSLADSAAPLFSLNVGLAGLSLGWLTVTLVSSLQAMVPSRLGFWCGIGTGIAYAFCNVPQIFNSDPRFQTAISGVVALLGLVSICWVRLALPRGRDRERETPRVLAASVMVFLLLVWLDSAAFYVIQHTPGLKGDTWGSDPMLIGNAVVHLLAAVAAGHALDRGFSTMTLVAAAGALAGACVLLNLSGSPAGTRLLYTAGVSLYSTALVVHPAHVSRPWFSAVLFSVAGWCGSALGIGMAQDLHATPLAFAVGAGVGVGLLMAVQRRWIRRAALGATLIVLGVFSASESNALGADDPLARQGRSVYLSEGCIHCHSQYVRPRVVRDVDFWGPAAGAPSRNGDTPPLIGNRRQGPDLSTIAARRSPEWQRLHLMHPRAVVPGSRMPSYAHLFSGNDPRGDALVAYLCSLGEEHAVERLTEVARWRPDPNVVSRPDAARGATLFGRLCVNCHGPSGRGEGSTASSLALGPPDFTRDPWRRVALQDPAPLETLARIVKFGVPGTAMAGHEYLSDEEAVGLAAYVQTLHKGEPPKP